MKLFNNTKLNLVLAFLLVALLSARFSISFDASKSNRSANTNKSSKIAIKKAFSTKKLSRKNRNRDDTKPVTAEEVESDIEKGPENNPKGMDSFYSFDAKNKSYLLILDNSVSLRNKFGDTKLSRRKIIQNILNAHRKNGDKINFCAASPLSTSFKWRVVFKWQVLPPVLKYHSPITFFGIKKCLNRVAKLEKKLGKQVFTNIHIVTDGYYLADRELPKLIHFLAPEKKYTADIIGNDVKSITTVRKWISTVNGKNEGIRFKFGEVFK